MPEKEQIDACVILEILLEQKRSKEQRLLQEKCRQYFYRLSEQGNGFMSLPALGEVLATIFSIADFQKRTDAISQLYDLLKESSIKLNSPTHETYRLAIKINEFDNRIEPADTMRLAEAITERAIFITLDKKLIDNARLEQAFGIKIKEPY